MKRDWDIFCSVVDNYGDIGVCWRLARQLGSDMGEHVRLWVDDVASFARICSAVDPASESQRVGAVEVRRWCMPFPAVSPAAIVVEGFGARLPDNYVEAMAASPTPPVWINLEHLSAEPWVDGCHGLPSPHPLLPLKKYFFFPGFTASTGGLLFESDLVSKRDAFQSDRAARAQFWNSLDMTAGADNELRISLFCYANAALPELIKAWAAGERAVTCVVPAGPALEQLQAIVEAPLRPGSAISQGRLTLSAIPFLDVDQYDRVLWACDLNFVRGEDSFVRAQLAARPLIWQAYVQEDGAHLMKQAAFVDRYVDGLNEAAAAGVRAAHEIWNRQLPGMRQAWADLQSAETALSRHAVGWAERITQGRNLATELAEFCQDRLE